MELSELKEYYDFLYQTAKKGIIRKSTLIDWAEGAELFYIHFVFDKELKYKAENMYNEFVCNIECGTLPVYDI